MKKRNYLKMGILFFIVLFCATGCIDYKFGMTINDDKSVDLSVSTSVDESEIMSDSCTMLGDRWVAKKENDVWMCCPSETANSDECQVMNDEETDNDSMMDDYYPDSLLESNTGEGNEKLKSKGYKVEEVNEENKTAIIISKNFKSIDDISKGEDIKFDIAKFNDGEFEEFFFKVDKGLFSNTYTAHFIYDLSSEEEMEDMSAYDEYFNYTYEVTLPVKTISNNASKLSNEEKTLTWNLELGKLNEIKYSFEIESSVARNIKIGISIASIIFIIATSIVIMTKQKRKKVN